MFLVESVLFVILKVLFDYSLLNKVKIKKEIVLISNVLIVK